MFENGRSAASIARPPRCIDTKKHILAPSMPSIHCSTTSTSARSVPFPHHVCTMSAPAWKQLINWYEISDIRFPLKRPCYSMALAKVYNLQKKQNNSKLYKGNCHRNSLDPHNVDVLCLLHWQRRKVSKAFIGRIYDNFEASLLIRQLCI